MSAEEQIEGLVEQRQVFVPVDEQRAQRGAQVGTASDANPFDGLNRVHHSLAMGVHTGGAQQASEEQEVGNELRQVPGRESSTRGLP